MLATAHEFEDIDIN